MLFLISIFQVNYSYYYTFLKEDRLPNNIGQFLSKNGVLASNPHLLEILV